MAAAKPSGNRLDHLRRVVSPCGITAKTFVRIVVMVRLHSMDEGLPIEKAEERVFGNVVPAQGFEP